MMSSTSQQVHSRGRTTRSDSSPETTHQVSPPSEGPNIDRNHETKPLPLLPPHSPHPPHSPKPVPTARAVPRQVAPDPFRLGLGVHPNLPVPSSHPLPLEQSHFSDEEEEDDDNDWKADEGNTKRIKSWFPPKPFQSRASRLQSPLQRAETRYVSSKRPQIVQSASRLSRSLSHLRLAQPRTRMEMAEVPIVLTPRDLRIDPPAPPSRTVGSPFQYHLRHAPDKQDTVIGPGEQQHRASHDHLNRNPSRELFAQQDSEQSNVVRASEHYPPLQPQGRRRLRVPKLQHTQRQETRCERFCASCFWAAPVARERSTVRRVDG